MRWLSLLVAVALVLCLVPLAYAAEVTGTFRIMKAPDVTAFDIYNQQTGGSVVTAMDPNGTYYARATVKCPNKLSYVKEVKVTLFYDVNGGEWNENEVPSQGDLHDCAILKWDNTQGWSADFGGSTTWDLDEDQCVVPQNLGQITEGTWVFAFKVGKVARADVLNGDDWRGMAIATNTGGKSGGTRNVTGKAMNFASEITVSYGQNNTVVWEVEPGVAFGGAGSAQTGIVTNYIANGPYKVPVYTTNWDGDVSGETADLDYEEEQPSGNNEFGLKAYYENNLNNAVRVKDQANAVAMYTSPQQEQGKPYATSESGEGSTTNTLWLALSENWTNESVEYTGSITFVIQNQ